MSTRNIPQLPQIRGSLKATAGHVRERSQTISGDLSRLDRDEEDVRIGAAAVLQHIEDERQPLREEADQLISILQAARGTTPQPALDQSDAVVPPAEPPAPPVEPAQADESQSEPPAQTEALEPAAQEPQETVGLPPAQEVPQRRRFFVVIREYFAGWSALSWLFAVIFLVATLLIMLATYPGFFPDRPEAIRFIVAFIVLPITFFMIGGFIGSLIDRARSRRQTAVEVHEEPAG